MKTGKYIRFRLSCAWEGIRSLFLLIRRLPGFYRLNRMWDRNPDFYGWEIRQYVTVMQDLTGGKLYKPSNDAATVIEAVWKHMDGQYAGWKKETEEPEKTE